MKRIVIGVLFVIFLMGSAYGTDIDLSGASVNIKDSQSLHLTRVTVIGLQGTFWADLSWDPVNQALIPTAYGKEQAVDPLLAKTELLKGIWTFNYHVGSPSYTDIYTLNDITGAKNNEGGYFIYGTGSHGDLVVASYYPSTANWALLHVNSYLFDDFYYFYTDGTNVLSGSCYYLAYHSGGVSNCYPLSGFNSALSSAALSASSISASELRRAADIKASQADENIFDADIAAKYWSLKLQTQRGE